VKAVNQIASTEDAGKMLTTSMLFDSLCLNVRFDASQ